VRAVQALDGELRARQGVEMAARIGVHTGRVVAGEVGGADTRAEMAVVGDTPSIAARVQSLAAPNPVVVGETTWRLLAGAFEAEDLGLHPLKGVAEPPRLRRIVRERAAEGGFEATHRSRLTPLVGREEEIGLLFGRWELAAGGEGQVVTLCGEPGIGKSRISRALRERLPFEGHARVQYQCSPFFSNTAFYPVIEQLQRAAGFRDDDAPQARLDRVEALLDASGGAVADAAPLLAALLSLPREGRFAPLALSPQRQKERTIQVVAEQLLRMAKQLPLLVIVEDVHWIDPTTLELLDYLVQRVASAAVLLMVTHRPEFEPAWGGYAHVTLHSLNRLSRRQCARLAQSVADKPLPDALMEHIVDKTDGVPLFVEELTKAVLESPIVRDAGDRFELSGVVDTTRIPATLHDSLMARLDRLLPMKEVAQIGAAIGRELSYPLLAAVSPMDDGALQAALERIVASDLVHQRGSPPNATYIFKHALVQDAAYESLLKRRRIELHAEIAEALETQFPEMTEAEPELVAHHYTSADRAARAVPYWLKAGQRALHRSALKEAVDHLTRGVQLLLTMPESAERDAQELTFQALLGTAQMMWKGYSNEQTGVAYRRADALLGKVGDSPQQFAVLWGVWAYYLVMPDYQQTLAAARRALAVAEKSGDRGLLVQALSLNCTTMWWMGRLLEAKTFTDRAREIYDEAEHGPQVWLYNHDALDLCMIYTR
jgi:tetratricopeptide (TPR) repeat protein